MRFNFRARLRRLELRMQERLARAAAEASLTVEEPEAAGLTEGPEQTPKAKKNEEYRRLHAQYRRMPLLELVRLYVNLKCRQREQLAKRRRDAQVVGPEVMQEINTSFEESARHETAYRESERWQRDNACDRGERVAASGPPVWRPEWSA